MVKTKNWVILLGVLLVAACNVSDEAPVVNQNNQNNPNNTNQNNTNQNNTNQNNTNQNNTNQNNTNQNNTNQNNTNQNNTNQNNSNNMTTVPERPLPSSAALTGGTRSMQSGNYKLKVSVGAPSANPKPKSTENQIEVAPAVPR